MKKYLVIEEDNNIIADCRSRTGFSKFRCSIFQMFQIIIFIFGVMVFIIIAFDNAKADPERVRLPRAFTSKVGPPENIRILANPRFKYREVYERELKSVALERTNKVRGARVNFHIVLGGKDKTAILSALRRLNLNIQEKAQLRRKFNQYQINPGTLEFAKFVRVHPTMIEAFSAILRDKDGIAIALKESRYPRIARTMGLRSIPMKRLSRDVMLPGTTSKGMQQRRRQN